MTPRLSPAQITQLLAEAEQHVRAGRLAEAENACRRVLATAPNNALATHYLGAVAFSTGNFDAALQLLQRATQLEPQVAAYFAALGEALGRLNKHPEAMAAYERAAALAPNVAEYHFHHGSFSGKLGFIDQSIASLKRAIQLKPDLFGAQNDLGITLTSARRVPEGLQGFRRLVQTAPDYRTAHDNLIYFMHFQSGVDGMTIRKEAEAWAARFAEPLKAQIVPHDCDRSPERRLRIGYVSPDLYEHPVGRFMQPILAQHDAAAFEVFCYSDAQYPDAHSQVLRSSVEHWLDSAALDDEALAQRIRKDQIDLLIDLSLHMGHNRLLTFARKPGIVQATYLGYAGTSGMSAMDWRISDPYLDPPGNDRFYTEQTFRLPRSYWCYKAPPFAAQLAQARLRDPASPITFACLNNIIKISDAALEAWAKVLLQVPGSRMVIQGEPGEHLTVMAGFFERAGVEVSRVHFSPKRSMLDYFRLYENIDIALDAFPYAGGTTTCDALWMGVPVVTLAGQTAVQRGGVSILSNLGLTDLITATPEQYIATAVALARDIERLVALRSELRRLMENSVLMQPREFVRDLERAWREIWKSWCAA